MIPFNFQLTFLTNEHCRIIETYESPSDELRTHVVPAVQGRGRSSVLNFSSAVNLGTKASIGASHGRSGNDECKKRKPENDRSGRKLDYQKGENFALLSKQPSRDCQCNVLASEFKCSKIQVLL
jgi:hypothetical protein